MVTEVSLIGFGEAGQAFAQAGGWGAAARAYDRLTDRVETRAAKQADYEAAGVHGAGNAAAAVTGAGLILSLVTADEALEAARSAAGALEPDALYCDFNSVAPQTKRQAAQIIESAGGRYVDVAVMAPVHPAGLKVPLLVSGVHAEDGAAALRTLGFAPRIVEGPVGRASTIRMLRSIIVKGIEALTAECFLAAEAAGVAEEVARSLDESETKRSGRERADYNLERMQSHGLRRAAEMEEVARTVAALGREPVMARATATVQRRVAEAAPASTPRRKTEAA